MKEVWILWEDVNEYPEDGGGEYVIEIYANEADAKAEAEKRNADPLREETEFYFAEKWEVK